MTGIDGATIRRLHLRPRPLDGPLPDVHVALDDAEYVVEWQVADDVVPATADADRL